MKMNYFVFGTNHMQAAVAFYDRLFDGSGVSKLHSEGRMTLWGSDEFMFAVAEPFDGKEATVGNGTMLGLNVGSAAEVERLHKLALANGGVDEAGQTYGQVDSLPTCEILIKIRFVYLSNYKPAYVKRQPAVNN